MEYEPGDHTLNSRQIAAAWVICAGIAGAALAMTSERPTVAPPATAETIHTAQAPDPCPLAGVRNPAYALCPSDRPTRLSALNKGNRAPISQPASTCS
jgi:hypothetical protein